MPLTGIVARFPLGVFRGHNPDGSIAPLPDTARLFSALLNAAGQGDTAVITDSDTTPSDEAVTALKWLEENPPDHLHLPATRRPRKDTETYREEGIINQQRERAKTLRHTSGTALDGPVAWLWETGIPTDVASTLDTLAADVSCLGEADSPVVLEVGEAEPTHHLDREATAFSRGGTRVRSIAPGRLDALEAAYRESRKKPRSESTKESAETTFLHPIPDAGTTTLLYRRTSKPATPVDGFVPWPLVVILPVTSGTTVTERTAVRWCVTLRAALLSHLGDDAPPAITGRYPENVPKPSNRVALQYLPAGLAAHHGIEGPAFLVMIPHGIDPVDEVNLVRRVKSIRSLRNGLGTQRLGTSKEVSGAQFWPADPPATLWKPLTPLIPEVRPRDQRCGQGPWTHYDTLNLSLGFLLRDNLGEELRANQETAEDPKATWRHLSDAVEELGFTVQDLYQLKDTQVSDFVHKTPQGMVIQPYRALLELPESMNHTTILALGQSRHLGGGLLIPTSLASGKESLLAFHS
ncbi:MAG: type I-U CRISPR-associated protein Csb2 [Arachnia propionica]|uniref:type I-G CRISPR-associated protein Csb2 n=1 Tax=Arachnia propionica TaxID=1750 RepID=UPI002704CFE7|nr:type I-U CRISPR-associated protein Csb2 [Arachnia propionica]